MARRTRKAVSLLSKRTRHSSRILHFNPLRSISTLHRTTLDQPKTWDFSELSSLGEFAVTVAREFSKWMDSYNLKSGHMKVTAVRHFFRFVDRRKEQRNFDSDQYWSVILKHWRTHLSKNRSIAGSTKIQYFGEVKGFVGHLQSAAVIPRFKMPRGFKNGVRSERKRTLAEATVKQTDADDAIDLPEILQFSEEATRLWGEMRNSPGSEVLRRSMIELLNMHLRVLRDAAQIEIRHIWRKHLETKAVTASTDVKVIRDFLHHNGGRFSRSLGSGQGSKSIFEDESSVLAWIYYRYRGLMPSQTEDERLYRLVTNKFAGVADLSSRFHLIADTLMPLCIPILMDTAMNVGCLFELSKDCKKPSHQNGLAHITWMKKRARGRELGIDVAIGKASQLQLNSTDAVSAPVAIDCLQALRHPLERWAAKRDRSKLLLFRSLGGNVKHDRPNGLVRSLSEGALKGAWARFLKRHPLLARLSITLDQIRPTLLLKCALESDGDILAVQRLAMHKNLETSARYVQSLPMLALGRATVRRVQEHIFVAATSGNTEILDQIGMNKAHAALLLAEARRMGFSMTSEVCERPVDNLTSELIYRFAIADAQSVAEMAAFRRHIVASQAQLLRDLPERWKYVWSPLALFLGLALDRMPPDIRAKGVSIAKKQSYAFAPLA